MEPQFQTGGENVGEILNMATGMKNGYDQNSQSGTKILSDIDIDKTSSAPSQNSTQQNSRASTKLIGFPCSS